MESILFVFALAVAVNAAMYLALFSLTKEREKRPGWHEKLLAFFFRRGHDPTDREQEE